MAVKLKVLWWIGKQCSYCLILSFQLMQRGVWNVVTVRSCVLSLIVRSAESIHMIPKKDRNVCNLNVGQSVAIMSSIMTFKKAPKIT